MEKQEDKEKIVVNELKNNQMYQYLNKHTNVLVQEIKLFPPQNRIRFTEIAKVEKGEDKLYLVGSESQLDTALTNMKKYDPNHTVALLQNTSGAHIFDSFYSEILDTDDLYDIYGNQTKVSIKSYRFNAKQMRKRIKEKISDNICSQKPLHSLSD